MLRLGLIAERPCALLCPPRPCVKQARAPGETEEVGASGGEVWFASLNSAGVEAQVRELAVRLALVTSTWLTGDPSFVSAASGGRDDQGGRTDGRRAWRQRQAHEVGPAALSRSSSPTHPPPNAPPPPPTLAAPPHHALRRRPLPVLAKPHPPGRAHCDVRTPSVRTVSWPLMAHQPGRGDRHVCLHSCRDVRRDSLLNERRCRRKTPRSECGRSRHRRAQGRRIVWIKPDKVPTW